MAVVKGARGSVERVVSYASKDGTQIACHVTGSGPALLVVHGTGGDHTSWTGVSPLLADHLTVYALDRRGRGASGDRSSYAFEREIEDVRAVAEGIGKSVHLYGHSFGAACAAEAAIWLKGLGSLILYEGGPRPSGLPFIPEDLIVELESLSAAGQMEEALVRFALTVAGLSRDELEVLKQSPAWPSRIAAAHTIPRELRAINEYGTDMEKFRTLDVPTLLLIGSEALTRRRQMFEMLANLLPNARLVELTGQGHAANQTAPHLLAEAIKTFVGGLQDDHK